MKAKALFAAVLILCAQLAFAKTWKVDKNGLGDYTTISQALIFAQAGDTVKVFPGTYAEKVVLNKNVVVVGSGAEATVVANLNTDFALEISAGKIMWFTITAQGHGIKANGGVVANCVAKGCKFSGFYTYDGAKLVNCISTENDRGFFVELKEKPTILNCIAYDNSTGGFYNPEWGYTYPVIYCCSFANGENFEGDSWKSTGTIELDPQFELDTYNIADSSPCKDAGNVGYPDPDGTRGDMGYYGGPDAPTFPVVKEARIVLNSDGTVTIQATGVSNY